MAELLDSNDILLIKKAIDAGGKIWENPILTPVKGKIKQYYRNIQDEQCCYCRTDTTGQFKMVLDIEHILPKKHFKELMFTICNLSVACKRCNMLIKKHDISFVTDTKQAKISPCNSELFKFIHPNSDNYYDHLSYNVEIANNERLIKYEVANNSSKGKYTYDYFKLKEIEVNSVHKAQGGTENEEVSELIKTEDANEIMKLLKNSH